MKNKEFITSAVDFVAALTAAGFNVETCEYGLKIAKKNCVLYTKYKYAPRSPWSRVASAQTGYLLKRPYELQGRHDRSNSGQITITFGKSIVSDIIAKIDAMHSDLVEYYEAKQEQKNADEIATDFLVAESLKWTKATIANAKGFTMFPQPNGTGIEQQLIELGVEKVYYSFANKGFIFTKVSIPYMQRVETDYYSNRGDTDLINVEAIETKVKFYRQVADLISKLNEYEQS